MRSLRTLFANKTKQSKTKHRAWNYVYMDLLPLFDFVHFTSQICDMYRGEINISAYNKQMT